MSDNNLVGDENDAVAAPAPTNGSSSESSDISIEKLNPEETEVVEDKTEEETKVKCHDFRSNDIFVSFDCMLKISSKTK